MSLPSIYLDAFREVARTKGFSSAANRLHITQSALSQRIKNLEEELGLTLFIRTPAGATLTDQGERLLRYCQTKDTLEEELVQELSLSKSFELSGTVRLAAYSSVLRSVLIPALKPLLEKHPNLLCEFKCANVSDLPGMLQRAETDFVVIDYRLDRANIQIDLLGKENFVVIEGTKSSRRSDVFLDNDSQDRATELFFKAQGGKAPKFRRSYLDDCYGIVDGVNLGLGRAVMSEHLVKNHRGINIVKGFKPFRSESVV